MKAAPEITMFDWLRLVEELNYAMDQAVGLENWDDFHIYGSSSDGFELLPQVCYQARVTQDALNGLREYIQKQGSWLLPVGIYVAAEVK
jgi:uncharacterized membrane protein